MEQGLSPDTIRKNRMKFLLIVLLFVLPVVVALTLKLTNWHPQSTGNYGTLVQPARPPVPIQFRTVDGQAASEKVFAGTWNLVVVTDGSCNSVCERNLFAIRQIHIAQGKNQPRVRRILISARPQADLSRVIKHYPEMTVLTADPDALEVVRNWTRSEKDGNDLSGSRIFVVDPLGNYMMYYNPDYNPAGMRKDLARLLRVSHIG